MAQGEGEGGEALSGDGEVGQSSAVGVLFSREGNRCSEVGGERRKGQMDQMTGSACFISYPGPECSRPLTHGESLEGASADKILEAPKA